MKHRKAEQKAEQVVQACIEILNVEKVCTITFDNGKESSRHEQIAEALNAEYFLPDLITLGREGVMRTSTD